MHVKWVALVDHDKLGDGNDDDDDQDKEQLNQNRYTRFLGKTVLTSQTLLSSFLYKKRHCNSFLTYSNKVYINI